MLNEIQAESLTYDDGLDTARIRAPGAKGHGRLALFDARGYLVGVDLRDDDPRGSIVMLGPHEAVASMHDIPVHVEGDDLVVTSARGSIRADEKNPYL